MASGGKKSKRVRGKVCEELSKDPTVIREAPWKPSRYTIGIESSCRIGRVDASRLIQMHTSHVFPASETFTTGIEVIPPDRFTFDPPY